MVSLDSLIWKIHSLITHTHAGVPRWSRPGSNCLMINRLRGEMWSKTLFISRALWCSPSYMLSGEIFVLNPSLSIVTSIFETKGIGKPVILQTTSDHPSLSLCFSLGQSYRWRAELSLQFNQGDDRQVAQIDLEIFGRGRGDFRQWTPAIRFASDSIRGKTIDRDKSKVTKRTWLWRRLHGDQRGYWTRMLSRVSFLIQCPMEIGMSLENRNHWTGWFANLLIDSLPRSKGSAPEKRRT